MVPRWLRLPGGCYFPFFIVILGLMGFRLKLHV